MAIRTDERRSALRRLALVPALLLTLAAGGCGGGDPPEAADPGAGPAADDAAMDGLSREQIQQQVEPLSPGRAQELGIIDTTATVADPAPGAPVIPGTGPEVSPGVQPQGTLPPGVGPPPPPQPRQE